MKEVLIAIVSVILGVYFTVKRFQNRYDRYRSWMDK
jgi:hypothetical protein